MKFLIDSGAFVRVAEKSLNGESIPLRTVETNRALFLKNSAGDLLQVTDQWQDFDSRFSGCEEEKLRDLRDGLTLLSCFGIAEIRQEAVPRKVRVAGERDYHGIAAFISENPNAGIGWLPTGDPEFYGQDLLRARQFLNLEYNFIYEEEGRIRALAILSVQKPATLSGTVVLSGCAFGADADGEEKERMLGELLRCATGAFEGEFCRIRFLQRDSGSLRLLETLARMGFREICTLEKETVQGGDVTVYDAPIPLLKGRANAEIR